MAKTIERVGPGGVKMILVIEETFEPVKIGDIRSDRLGQEWEVLGGSAPERPRKSGYILVRSKDHPRDDEHMFNPTVVGCRWMEKGRQKESTQWLNRYRRLGFFR